MSKHRPPPEVCPVCGEDLARKALACPECGADWNSGWREDALDGLDLPDEEFDYDSFVAEEFGGKSPVPRGLHPFWWVAAIITLLAFGALIVFSR